MKFPSFNRAAKEFIRKGVNGGGGGGLIVTFTKSGSDYSADKTFAEISAAAASMPVIGVYNGQQYTLAKVTESNAQFSLVMPEYDDVEHAYTNAYFVLNVSSSDTVSYASGQFS